MSLNTYNSSKFQVESFFRSGMLSQFQIDQLVKILNVLAKYMLIDRDILNVRAKEKIGLSHIQRAVNLNLIVELKDIEALNASEDIHGNHYFYHIGFAGINFLRVANKNFYCFNIDATFENKEKVLIMNYNSLERNYDLLFSDYNDTKYYNFFHLKDLGNNDVILYFDKHITEDHVKSLIKRQFIRKLSEEQYEFRHQLFENFISKFRFETIEIRETTYTKNLKYRDTYKGNLLIQNRFKTEDELSGWK